MPKILVVDDESAMREGVGELLRAWGFEVSTVDSGVEAQDIFRQDSSIELILSARRASRGQKER